MPDAYKAPDSGSGAAQVLANHAKLDSKSTTLIPARARCIGVVLLLLVLLLFELRRRPDRVPLCEARASRNVWYRIQALPGMDTAAATLGDQAMASS